MLNSKEKAILSNSLVVILKACLDKIVIIDLRNESSISGNIEIVTVEMNVTLSNATFTCLDGKSIKYNEITIRGNNIRFVHIPDSVDMIGAIQNQVNSTKRVKNFREFKKKTIKKP
jgi:small nuclear ribonucleoprotein (snRNP)-like protein